MANIFDMSSGKIQSEHAGVTRVDDYHIIPETGTALQEVRELPEPLTPPDVSRHHIRELLKKL